MCVPGICALKKVKLCVGDACECHKISLYLVRAWHTAHVPVVPWST